jgi:hypothetical protein
MSLIEKSHKPWVSAAHFCRNIGHRAYELYIGKELCPPPYYKDCRNNRLAKRRGSDLRLAGIEGLAAPVPDPGMLYIFRV